MVISSHTDPVEGRVMALKDVYDLIPGTGEYDSTLHGKGDFAELIKLRISRWKYYPGLSLEEGGRKIQVRGDVTTETEGQSQRDDEDISLKAVKMEEGPHAKEHRWPLEAGKGKEMDSPLGLPEGMLPG